MLIAKATTTATGGTHEPENSAKLKGNAPVPLAYTVKQALGAVPLSRSSFYLEMAAGRLRSFKIGKRRLIAAADLNEWLAAQRDATGTASAGTK